MGDMFSGGSSASQSTENRQVGVSGGGSGQSGDVYGAQAGIGSMALKDLNVDSGMGGSTIVNITSGDIEALHAATDVMHDVLGANQNVSLGAINASGQVAINALQALNAGQMRSADLIENATARSQEIALMATPQSPAAYAETMAATSGEQNKTLIIGAVVVLVIMGGMIYLNKK